MSRPLKIVLILAAVVAAIGLLVPYVVNVDRYRPLIVAEAEKQTGRKMEIGSIRARLFPSLGFALQKVTLGPPAGFADVNLLSAEEIRGSIAFFPLLRGEVKVTSVHIEQPTVTLASDEHGRTNYDFTTAKAGIKPASYHPASSSSASALALDSVSISDATIELVEVRSRKPLPPSLKLSAVSADFRNVDLSSQGIERLQGRVPLSGAKLALAGAPPLTFRSGEMKLENGAAAGNCEVELTDVGRVKGDISIPNFHKLIAAAPGSRSEAEGTVKLTSDKLRFAPYEITNISANMQLFPTHIDGPVTATAYGGSINVHARLDTAATPSRLSANLQVSQVDIEKLLAGDPSTRGKMTGHGELKMRLAAPLSGNLEHSLTGEGSFALRDGKLPGVQIGKTMRELSKVEEILSLGASGHEPAGETTYSVINGDLEIRGGRIHTNKTHLETNVGSGDINGSVGFDKTLDLTGTWNLPKGSRAGAATAGMVGATVLSGGILAPALLGAGGAMLKVPFTVRGTANDPQLTPGGGFSGSGSSDSQQTSAQQQPQKKKKLFGIFGKP